jgi:hypothetical protein
MVEPVLGSVFDKGNVAHIVLVHAIVHTEKNAHAGLGEDDMCRLEKDVIAGDILA